MTEITLATRGSDLALWQARRVAARLRDVHRGLHVRLLEVRTVGDRVQDRPLEALSAVGVFTKEVDSQVLDGLAHAAVHSLKDQITTLQEPLVLGMVLERGPIEDVVVGRGVARIADLSPGARVATGSLRRRAQILRVRGDVIVVPIRGNVPRRVEKLDAGEAEALILARAGLERLGLGSRITEVLDTDTMLPAVSQGIVGVTCLADDVETRRLLEAADHSVTHVSALAERAFLRTLGGGCNVPAGALATVTGDVVHLVARVLDRDGRRMLSGERRGKTSAAADLGEDLARDLLHQGAAELIQELRA
jgi:hydroxymethylbilane synthase